MRPIRWFGDHARTLRGFLTRVHRRSERLPTLPFGVAAGVALAFLLVALDNDPEPSRESSAVDEQTIADLDAVYANEYIEVPVELELIESGFGMVTGPSGEPRLSVGALLRNPHESEVGGILLALTGAGDDGQRRLIEHIPLGTVPAETTVPLGHIAVAEAADATEPRLEIVEAMRWELAEPISDEAQALLDRHQAAAAPPEIEVVETVPLFSPRGWRTTYRVDAEQEIGDVADGLALHVVFRDDQGRIVGGMPAWGDPFDSAPGSEPPRAHALPAGTSWQVLDLPAACIPDRADLDSVEIGPGR